MSRILVVEDDPDIRELLELRLTLMKHDVVSTHSAAGVPAAVAAAGPLDAAILDIVMPDVDGFELLQGLRADPFFADLPVIILTARQLHSDLVTAEDFGAAFLTKPIDVDELSRVLDQALKLSRR